MKSAGKSVFAVHHENIIFAVRMFIQTLIGHLYDSPMKTIATIAKPENPFILCIILKWQGFMLGLVYRVFCPKFPNCNSVIAKLFFFCKTLICHP